MFRARSLLLLGLESFTFECISHHKIIGGYADCQSREECQGIPYYQFEDSHKAGLHSHIDKVAGGESQSLLGIGIAMKSKETGEEKIGNKTNGITDNGRDDGGNTDSIDEHDIYAILQESAKATDESETDDFRIAGIAIDKRFKIHDFR